MNEFDPNNNLNITVRYERNESDWFLLCVNDNDLYNHCDAERANISLFRSDIDITIEKFEKCLQDLKNIKKDFNLKYNLEKSN